MFSVVPTRVEPDESSLNIDILRALGDGNAKAVQHLHSPVRTKGKQLQVYDTTVALQIFQEPDDLKTSDCESKVLPMAHDYAVMVEAIPSATGKIVFRAVYSNRFLDQNSATLMLSQLDEILIWILANPMLPYFEALNCLTVPNLSILNPDSQAKLAAERQFLHSAFESCAGVSPDKSALEFWYVLDEMPGSVGYWTYAEFKR